MEHLNHNEARSLREGFSEDIHVNSQESVKWLRFEPEVSHILSLPVTLYFSGWLHVEVPTESLPQRSNPIIIWMSLC